MLSTSPSNYTVIDPEGCISSKNSVDLIVRLTSTVPYESAASHFEDKFRVQIYDYNTRQQLGRKDVPSVIHFGSGTVGGNSSLLSGNFPQAGLNVESSASEAFQQCPSLGLMSSVASSVKNDPSTGMNLPGGAMFYNPSGSAHYNPNYVAVLTALICIIGLMLPTSTSDKDGPSAGSGSISPIPTYLHLSVNQKLLIAYTLGLVTMVIFRPQ